MYYISEINAFYDWLETNESPKAAIALWHALMHINNKTRWQPIFSVAISSIESKTGFKRSELFKARNFLQQKGLIKWRDRGGRLSAEYKIIPFGVRMVDANGDANGNANSDTTGTTNGTINKLNYTKQREGAPKSISNFDSNLIHDIEAELTKNQILFEKICMAAGEPRDVALVSLHKYHLHLQQYEKYPASRKGSYAGFEKWLMNEKQFMQKESKSAAVPSSGPHISVMEAHALQILNSVT